MTSSCHLIVPSTGGGGPKSYFSMNNIKDIIFFAQCFLLCFFSFNLTLSGIKVYPASFVSKCCLVNATCNPFTRPTPVFY